MRAIIALVCALSLIECAHAGPKIVKPGFKIFRCQSISDADHLLRLVLHKDAVAAAKFIDDHSNRYDFDAGRFCFWEMEYSKFLVSDHAEGSMGRLECLRLEGEDVCQWGPAISDGHYGNGP